jgi:multiple sugar transport system substrate-binding protein
MAFPSSDKGRRRRVRAIAAASTAVLLTVALASCSSAADSDASAGDGELSGEVVFWHSFTQGPRAEYMERMAERFEAEHPDVDIRIETFSWGEFQTKWTTGLAAGQVPDLSTAQPNQVVQMINVGALAPVDDVIDAIGRDRFTEAALGEGAVDGVSYSLPIYSHAQVMWYRSDLLDAAGIEVPETWDELKEAAAALTAAPDQYGLAVPMGTNDLMATRFLNFYLQSAGESLLNDDGRANLTSDAAIDGIEYWVDMYGKTSPEGSVNYNVLDQATLFYQGKTAFDFNSGFQISGVVGTSPELESVIKAAPLPRLDADDEVYGGETSNIATVVWEKSDVQEEAKAFLEYLYQDEDYIDFLHSVPGGMLPSLQDIAENEAYLDDETLQRHADSVAVISEAVPAGTAIGMEDGPLVQSGILTSQAVIEKMMQDIVLNGTDVETAAKAAEDQLNQLFVSSGVSF